MAGIAVLIFLIRHGFATRAVAAAPAAASDRLNPERTQFRMGGR